MLRTFDHFPEDSKCPLCGTNKDKETFLIAISGTKDGHICEAQPTHVECFKNAGGEATISKEHNVIVVPINND